MGGPTNGRADACRRRLAAVELTKPPHQEGGFVDFVEQFFEGVAGFTKGDFFFEIFLLPKAKQGVGLFL